MMERRDLVPVPEVRELPPEERSDYPSSARNGLLWFAVLGGPAAWIFDELAAFFLHQSWCAAATTYRETPFGGITVLLLVVGLIGAGGAVVAGWLGLRAYGDAGLDTGRDGTHIDRRRFMAHAGMIISVLFLFGIVLRWIAVLFVSPTICNLGS